MEFALNTGVYLRLNAGTHGSGAVIVRSVQLGRVANGAPAAKLLPITDALADVLEFPVIRVERRVITQIEA